MDEYIPNRTFDPEQVPDGGRCQACGATVDTDSEQEYRHRFVLEDHSGTTESAAFGKLCGKCWWKLYDFVDGVERPLD